MNEETYREMEIILSNKLSELQDIIEGRPAEEKLFQQVECELWNVLNEGLPYISLYEIKRAISINVYNKESELFIDINRIERKDWMNLNKKEVNDLYDEAVRLWGEKTQIDMMVEECSELIKALCKFNRNKSTYPRDVFQVLENVREEIVDVDIVLGQMKRIFDLEETCINEIREKKLTRLKNKVENYKENE